MVDFPFPPQTAGGTVYQTNDGLQAVFDDVAAAINALGGPVSFDAVSGSFETLATAGVASIAASVKSVIVKARAAAGDGGEALYKRVASEPSHAGKFRSADIYLPDGSTDAGNGGWWEIVEGTHGINVIALGADPTGTSDTTSSVQDALGISGRIYFPPGTYRINGLDLDGDNLRLYGPKATLRKDAASVGAGMFNMADTASLRDFEIEFYSLVGAFAASPIFNVLGTCTRGRIKVFYLNQSADAATLTNANDTVNAQMFHCTFEVQFWDSNAANTVPAINWSGPGNLFNANRFEVRRCDGVAVPWCVIDSTNANRFKGIVFEGFQLELCDAGWLKLGGVAHVTVKDVTSFDNGTITAPLVELVDGSGGAKNINVKISHLFRAAGTLSGTSDIKITGTSQRGIIIEECGAETLAAGFTIDVNGNTRTSIRDLTYGAIVNAPTHQHAISNFRDWDTKVSGVTTPALVIPQGTATADRKIIATGAIAYDGRSGIMLDTEGAAGTDDLDTIDATDAPNGTIVFLSTFVDTRDVVVKHNTGNIILKAGADTTLASRSQLVTLRYSALVSKWLEI